MSRLRATLSAVGVIVGIATVITAIAIGEGARRAAVNEIGALGVENVFIRSVSASVSAEEKPNAPALTTADAQVLAATIPGVEALAILRSARAPVEAGATHVTATLVGVSPSWRAIAGARIGRGRWLSDLDANDHRRVVVLGEPLARRLFGVEDPVGRQVRAGGAWFVVVGVLSEDAGRPASASVQGFDTAEALFMPFGAMDMALGRGDSLDRVEQVALRTAGPDVVGRVAAAAASVLARRRLPVGSVEVIVPRELLAARLRAQRTFNVVLLAIGSLALVISGIGIMNVMLASVAERTQEIGVRRAFGASRHDVVAQFATESAALCVCGGIAGVPVGALLSAGVAFAAGWPVAVPAWSVGAALALAGVVGLGFGIYPALRASRVQPIDALRAV